MPTKTTMIARKTKIYYSTYALFPANAKEEDLAYASDRLVLYRRTAGAWVAITIHASSGLASAIPTAANLPGGSLYFETDTSILKQVQAGAWVTLISKSVLLSGLIANIPGAANVVDGAIYFPLDDFYINTATAGAWVLSYDESYFTYIDGTLADFQANAATGDLNTSPQNINSNNPAAAANDNLATHYAQVLFNQEVKLNQWRQYGSANNIGDGVWKLQYRDADGAWVDWVLGIATRDTADWSAMTAATEIITKGIRLVDVTVDSSGNSWIAELEVYHD